MELKFNHTERHVLENQGGYSRQLIDYWEKQGYVPSKHILRVRDLIGRRIEELLGDNRDVCRFATMKEQSKNKRPRQKGVSL